MKTTNTKDVGVIVGRFQVHELHEAHKDLIQSVLDRHDRVLLFLGKSVLSNTKRNPLDFRSRAYMIQENFPQVEVFYITDHPDDDVWSKNLDKTISEQLRPMQSVMLYGSRDSFIKGYSGKFSTCELESSTFISGTAIRKKIANSYVPSKDFRAGVIVATEFRYPTAFQTVDVAVIHVEKKQVLLARKPDCKLWRFIGGFSDPNSNSLEEDAIREVEEEAKIVVNDVKYIGSTKIDDWRYRSEVDKIKTAFFTAIYVSGTPEGADDIEEVKWFSFEEDFKSLKSQIEPCHLPLFSMLLEFLETKQEY